MNEQYGGPHDPSDPHPHPLHLYLLSPIHLQAMEAWKTTGERQARHVGYLAPRR